MRDSLPALRRMYHHLCNGGKATASDVERFGGPVTKETIAARIVVLESEQAVDFAWETSREKYYEDDGM